MGLKLLWTGLTIIVALAHYLTPIGSSVEVAGAIVMVLGLVLLWLDK